MDRVGVLMTVSEIRRVERREKSNGSHGSLSENRRYMLIMIITVNCKDGEAYLVAISNMRLKNCV